MLVNYEIAPKSGAMQDFFNELRGYAAKVKEPETANVLKLMEIMIEDLFLNGLLAEKKIKDLQGRIKALEEKNYSGKEIHVFFDKTYLIRKNEESKARL